MRARLHWWAAAVRLLLALAALAIELTSAAPANSPRRLFILAFSAYAVAAVLSRSAQRFANAPPGLAVDVAFLLVCASLRGAPSAWLSAAVFAFLLVAALLFHSGAHLLAIAAVCLPLLVALRPEDARILAPGMLVGAAVGLVASRQKERLTKRIEAARESDGSNGSVGDAIEAERRRLAADFHDGPLQGFASFQMRLEIVRKVLQEDPAAAMKELLDLQELALAQSREIRSFIHSLSGVVRNGAGFHSSLRQLVAAFHRESGIAATLGGADLIGPIDSELAGEALKIVREALHNAQKHSGASQVAVSVEKSASALEIGIRDNGAGFPFNGPLALEQLEAMQLGPETIKRRVRALGGSLTVESHPGAGAELRISIPV